MPVKIDFKKIILVLLLLAAVVCIVLGFYDEKSSTFSFQTDAAREQLRIICLFMCILIAVFVNTVFHEAGHYIAGKQTGWELVSLKIGKRVYLKTATGWQKKRGNSVGASLTLAMLPPDMEQGKFPFTAYRLGGAAGNLVLTAIGFLFYLAVQKGTLLSELLLLFGIISAVFLITAAVPFRMRKEDSDGLYVLQMKSFSDIRDIVWKIEKITASFALGLRLRDMPEEWFRLPRSINYDDRHYCTLQYWICRRYMDLQEFETAKQEMGKLLGHRDPRLNYQQTNDLRCDNLFIRFIQRGSRREKPDIDQQTVRYAMENRDNLMILRLYYAHKLLVAHDLQQAKAYRKEFEEAASRCPYDAQVAMERDLIAYAATLETEFGC